MQVNGIWTERRCPVSMALRAETFLDMAIQLEAESSKDCVLADERESLSPTILST